MQISNSITNFTSDSAYARGLVSSARKHGQLGVKYIVNEDAIKEEKPQKEAEIKRELWQEYSKAKNPIQLMRMMGIKVRTTKDGKALILSEYRQPSGFLTYKDLGWDEQKILNKVEAIEGDANICQSNIKKFSPKAVGGSIISGSNHNEIDFSNLEYLGEGVINIGLNKDSKTLLVPQKIKALLLNQKEGEKLYPEDIFDACGFKYDYYDNLKIRLYNYNQPSKETTFADLGIDEKELLKDVVSIFGTADFRNSALDDKDIETIRINGKLIKD